MKKIWNFITGLKNAVGNIMFLLLAVLLATLFITQETPGVPDSAVMIIDPEGLMVEQKQAVDPFEQFLAGDEAVDAETLSRDVTDAIEFAGDDDRIKAIALDLSKLQGGSLAVYEDLGHALNNFKETGKPVYAFGPSYSQAQYLLASHANHIYVDSGSHPIFGAVFLRGLGMYPFYMKSALEKLKVNVHVFKAGLYKDAAETFVRDGMSESSRESNQELINSLWSNIVATLTSQRDLPEGAVNAYINNYPDLVEAAGADPVKLALDQGFIDKAVSRQQWREEMQAISGQKGDSYNHVGYRTYLSTMKPAMPVNNPARDKIAVIVAKGTILDGDHPAGTVGGDTVARIVRQARNDDSVKAIVLRVDSPGGSAAASELIRSELWQTQESGKPVVASMGGYAASGGYWISSTANRIFASKNTITGSIGVFSIFPKLDQSAAGLGLYSDGVGTNSLSDAFNSFTPLSPVFAKTMQDGVGRTYNTFLNLVSKGRGISVEEADEAGQGRVWIAEEALARGLIDGIGNLDDAVESAAMLADIDDYDVVFMEKQLSPREQLIQQLLETSLPYLPVESLSFVSVIPRELRVLTSMAKNPGIYSQCLACTISF